MLVECFLLATVIAVVFLVKFYYKFFLLSRRIPTSSIKFSIPRDESKFYIFYFLFDFADCDFISVFPLLEGVFEKCGDYAFIWIGPLPAVLVRDPTIVNEVLTSKSCYDKGPFYFGIKRIFCDGILTLPHLKWQKHRKVLNSGFKHKFQLSFIPIINHHARLMNTKLKESVGKEEFDVRHLVEGSLMRIASETFMGKVDVKDDNLPLEEYDM